MKQTKFSSVLLYLLLLSTSISGQRVALVLSGGAAKGGAHIGVIRALEENQIPITYIAGTSIGAIIGVLYAAGYTPDEMEAFIGSNEFQQWASGTLDDHYTYYYWKEDPNASWINLNVNFKKKISSILPTNLVSPFEIDYHFMTLLAPVNAVCRGNFDSLMVPYRCVVSDIDSTEAIVMRNGDLSTAVRASMSIPIIFNPVIIKKKLIFDGGMYNNFPCNVAIQDFHPDIIIGSRVSQRYDKPDPDDIISQVLTMLMEKQNDTIPFKQSVMITPSIPKISLLDFSFTKILADSGYLSTMRKMSQIRGMIRDSISPEIMIKKREAFKKKIPPLVFDSISTTGLTKAQEKYIIKLLKRGKNIIPENEFRRQYFRLIDQGMVKKIFPVAEYDP
ncbi:MAG: patatin-like phospholipase family protein, partial [bacterium]